MTVPKLTVCIPTYNYGRYLAEAVQSVLVQTFDDFELLVIDDCSGDETDEVMRQFAERDARVRYLRNAENLGMVANWNLCLRLARGEYVKFVFGDDLLASPDALQRMVAVLDSDATVSLVASSRNVIDGQSRILKIDAHFTASGTIPGTEVINRCLREQKNLIGEPTVVMFRKDDARRGFNPSYRQIVDLEMWFHLLEKGLFAYINEPLCAFRVHDQQQTKKNRCDSAALDDNFHLVDEYLAKEYIHIGSFWKAYIRYDNAYRIWKLYKTDNVSRTFAVDKIESKYGFRKFAGLYPLYKIYKPCMKLFRSIGGAAGK